MDVVNALAAILQLSEQLLQLGDKCHRSIRKIRNPSQEVWDFHSMFSTFGNSLFLLHTAASETINQDCSLFRCQKTQNVIVWAYELSKLRISPIEDAIRTLRTLQDNNKSRTSLVKAKLLWTLCDRHDISRLLVSIEPLKACVTQLSIFFNIRTSLEAVKNLQTKSEAVPPELVSKLSILQREENRLIRECKGAVQCYQDMLRRNQQLDTRQVHLCHRTGNLASRVQTLIQEQAKNTKVIIAELKQCSSSTLSSSTMGNTSQSYSEERFASTTSSTPLIEPEEDIQEPTHHRSASVDSPSKNRYSIVSSTKTESTITPQTLHWSPPTETTRSVDAIDQRCRPRLSQIFIQPTNIPDPDLDHIRNRKRKSTREAQPSTDQPTTTMTQPDHSFRSIDNNSATAIRELPIRTRNTNPERPNRSSSSTAKPTPYQPQSRETSRWSMTSVTESASSSDRSSSAGDD